MATKKRNFYAFQIDLHYLDPDQHATDAVKWDPEIITELFTRIVAIPESQRGQKYKDSWLMYLSSFSNEEHYLFGKFLSAEYGTVGELIHADTHITRPNPKAKREGELEATYFYIRKADGFMLLQGSQRLTRARFEEYIEKLGNEVITENNLTYIQVCTLVEKEFFDHISELTSVNKLMFEVTKTELAADESQTTRALQNDIEEISATDVKLEFVAKYQRSGMNSVIDLVRRYKQQKGVTKIVVKGKVGNAEKIINMEESQEKYARKVEVDTNNQPMLTSVENVLIQIASQRRSIRG
ncbi:hypothetical protein [Paenibacillus fonticola]|uniref:hypothetical protein n=1 Tax=Paenibacillus fonticola TaxID=379896 RepID=UPI0003718BEC|nr:hypothetical protein [Paenibacillus fonticola]